jgi:hypothetical protein
MKRSLAFLAIAACAALALPVAASAQPAPSYADQGEQIHGTIASIGGKYTIYVRDARGFVDTVQLHDGTVINPTGLTLAPGQTVTISGRTDGHAFAADEIDTPYNIDDGVAYAPAYAPYYVAPYPYYAYYPAYALSYPAFISIGFGFGGYYGHYGYYGGPGFYGRGYYGGPGYYAHGYYGGGYYHGAYPQGSGYSGYGATRRFPQGGGASSYGTSRAVGGGSRTTTSMSRSAGGPHR